MGGAALLLGWIVGAGALLGAASLDRDLLEPPPGPTPPPPDLAVEAPPVLLLQRRLPGLPPRAARHTERGELALVGDHVVAGQAGQPWLFAYDRASLALVQRLPARGPVQSAPVPVGDDLVYCDTAGTTWRRPVEGGEPRWVHEGVTPIYTAPVVAGDRVIVSTVDDLVYALDLATGELLWRYQEPPDPTRPSELTLLGAPRPAIAGDLVVTGFSTGRIVALDLATGEPRWNRPVGEGRYPDIVAPPLLAGGDLYVGGFTGPLLALDPGTRAVRWRLEAGIGSEPLAVGDVLYVSGSDGRLRAVDRLSGTEIWRWEADRLGVLTRPQLLPAGLLVASSDGGLHLVDPDTGASRWSFDPGWLLDGVTVAPLVVGREVVVLTNAARLLTLRVPDPATGPRALLAPDLW